MAEALEDALAFLTSRASAWPAFNDLEREKPEKIDAGEFQIESQIFCDLLDGANPVEL